MLSRFFVGIRSFTLIFLTATCSGAVLAQSGGSWFPAMPSGNPSPTDPAAVFLPKAGFPRPGDPGQKPALTVNPFCRVGGIHGFTDTLATKDPNDDREYLVACRSDGIHLIDVTPRSGQGWTASASLAIIPATNSVKFLLESQPLPWGTLYLAPRYDLYNGLNFDPGGPFAPSPAAHPFPYTSQSTTNREAVAWYEASSDRWFLYSASLGRPGIWVMPLQRVNGILDFISGADTWFSAGNTMGYLHSIYIDHARAQLWVCQDFTPTMVSLPKMVYGVQIVSGGVLSSALVMSKNYTQPVPLGTPHDAMPVGDRLFVSMSERDVHVFRLPTSGVNPPADTTVHTATISAGHSCYFDTTLAPTAVLYANKESRGNNFSRFDYVLGNPDSYSSSSEQITHTLTPIPPIVPDDVHYIRGVMRTGVFPNYNSGLTLASLLTTQPYVMGSYDTSFRASPVTTGNTAQNTLNRFDGTWDAYPGADSGMVCASAGELGSVVFQVKQGMVNRYWNATPFQPGAAAQWMFPKIIAPFGPARKNNAFLIKDANAASYPTAGGAIQYRYTLYLSQIDPVLTSGSWLPSVVTVPGASTGYSALDYTPGTFWTSTNPVLGDDIYSWSTMGTVPDVKWFAQMVVEEVINGADTGRWAASRGTWIGVGI